MQVHFITDAAAPPCIQAVPPAAPSCLGLCATCRQPIFDNQRVCLQDGKAFCMDCTPPARPAYNADAVGRHGAFWACLLVGFFGLVALFAVCFR